MNAYTVVFDHPDDGTPECMPIRTTAINYVHLMFFGTLAREWGYDWEDMWFDKRTDLFSSYGTIIIKNKPLSYEILVGQQKRSDRLDQHPTCKTVVQ